MRKVREILRLRWSEQLSLRDVATALAMPHATVALYERRALDAGLSWPLPDLDDGALEAMLLAPTPERVTREQPDFAYLQRELRHKGVTLQLLFDEYREAHPDGYAYSQFCKLYREWRRRLDVVMRQDHRAGEKLFVDFPGLTIPIYDDATLAVSYRAELFVAVLGVSNYFFVEALRSQELEHWVNAHAHCFAFLGGVPSIVVCDNLKSGVTKASRYEPDLNATFQEMAAHYGTAVIPARPYKPRDKAKVEVGVQIVERWIMARLRKEHFTSLGELNEAIASLVERANAKPFKKMEGSRASVFLEIDQPALRPLPDTPYEFASWRRAKVNIDYHVEVERHYYSVPYQLARDVVEVRLTSSVVEVFHKNKRVAAHLRRDDKGHHSTEAAHMPDSHRRYLEWTPGRIVAWAEKNGPATGEFINELLLTRPHPEQGFRSALGVMGLAKKYGPQRLEAACARALALRSFSYSSVASILKHGLDQRPLPTGSTRAHPVHSNIRGSNYYH
jgi:transposase